MWRLLFCSFNLNVSHEVNFFSTPFTSSIAGISRISDVLDRSSQPVTIWIFCDGSSLACWKHSHKIDLSIWTATAKTNLYFACQPSVIIALDRDGGWSIQKSNSWRLRFRTKWFINTFYFICNLAIEVSYLIVGIGCKIMECNSVVKIDYFRMMVLPAKNFWNSTDKRNRFFKTIKAVFAYNRGHNYECNIQNN